MRFMARQRLSIQIAVICWFFTLPFSLALFFIIRGFNKDIEFARLELSGNQYQRPLE